MFDQEKIDQIKEWLGSGSINIFGRPFSGKDAQGIRLAEVFGGNLIGGGDILRNSTIPERVSKMIRAGKLAPTDDYINIVLPYFKQENLKSKPLILSCVGRWHGEEDGVMGALSTSNHPLKAVIYLDISNDESHIRWKAREINNDRQNRHDDTEAILDTRFKEFEQKTMPVLDYYDQKGLLIKINGQQTRDQVEKDILNALFRRSFS